MEIPNLQITDVVHRPSVTSDSTPKEGPMVIYATPTLIGTRPSIESIMVCAHARKPWQRLGGFRTDNSTRVSAPRSRLL